MRQEKQPLPGRGTPSPPFPSNSRMKEGRLSPHAVAGGMAVTGTQENDAALSLFRFYRSAACFFSVHTTSIPPGMEILRLSMQEREFLTGTEQKRRNKQKVHLQGINRPPHRAEAAAVNPFYCTRIVCSISSFRRGAVTPPTISFSFIPSRYRTVRGTASRPYLRARSG